MQMHLYMQTGQRADGARSLEPGPEMDMITQVMQRLHDLLSGLGRPRTTPAGQGAGGNPATVTHITGCGARRPMS